ncbi:hypothetical protein ACRRRS_21885 (plasmid) [Brucella anthropi]|uniref:hypothetical protein n=1 Tax=Brucella anthropi TaxID=529 RepID=UPI003D7F022E
MTYLTKLMLRAPLAKTTKLGPEDRSAIDFANRLRVWTLEGKLKAVWTHVPNEIAGGTPNAKIRYAVSKALGQISGASDYVFMWATGGAAIEFKAGRNVQQENQLHFETWCKANGVPYFLVYSADEGEAKLRELGVLS